MSSNHERFLVSLMKSEETVRLVAEWLIRQGYFMELRPIRGAPSADQHEKYSDRGDCFIVEDSGLRRRVEVKQVEEAHFTCADDWPWPHIYVVGDIPIIDRQPRAWVHIRVNPERTHAGIVWDYTRVFWRTAKVPDKITGRSKPVYTCPLQFVEWRCLATDKLISPLYPHLPTKENT